MVREVGMFTALGKRTQILTEHKMAARESDESKNPLLGTQVGLFCETSREA
jgi:hypothetical protein